MILFGLTGKSNVSIEEIWSDKSAHYAPFAVITMSRDRFNLIFASTILVLVMLVNTINFTKWSKFS